ncbi:hypothetical protein GCM10009745_70880 [Kribbella yunnanensis]|uniref:Aspartate/glutamate racemase family protein n=1 Tax=Kribbella yunnanensis TaxID=190194 RepID=A0ABP4UW47_9ACTN
MTIPTVTPNPLPESPLNQAAVLILTPEGSPFIAGSIADPAEQAVGSAIHTYPPDDPNLDNQFTTPIAALIPRTVQALSAESDTARGSLAVLTVGYLSRVQHDLARATNRTVLSSPLLAVPMLLAMLPPGRRVLVVYANLGWADLSDIPGVPSDRDSDVIRVGLEEVGPFRRAVFDRTEPFDHEAVSAQIIEKLDIPDLGAVVLECGEMAAVADRIRKEVDVPVIDYHVLASCFAAALSSSRAPSGRSHSS